MRQFRGNTWLWILIALMAVSSMRQYSSVLEWAMIKAITLPGILIGLSFHEYAHAKAADMLGDPTAKNMGRCNIYPTSHFDIFGFLALLFLGFGWGVPVPVNPYNFKNRRKGEIIVSLAGVATNFVLAIVFGFIYMLMFRAGGRAAVGSVFDILTLVVYFVVQINLVLMVFNLIPVPPLDGFNALDAIVGFRQSDALEFIRRNSMLILLFLILFNVIDLILSPAVSGLMNLIFRTFSAILL